VASSKSVCGKSDDSFASSGSVSLTSVVSTVSVDFFFLFLVFLGLGGLASLSMSTSVLLFSNSGTTSGSDTSFLGFLFLAFFCLVAFTGVEANCSVSAKSNESILGSGITSSVIGGGQGDTCRGGELNISPSEGTATDMFGSSSTSSVGIEVIVVSFKLLLSLIVVSSKKFSSYKLCSDSMGFSIIGGMGDGEGMAGGMGGVKLCDGSEETGDVIGVSFCG